MILFAVSLLEQFSLVTSPTVEYVVGTVGAGRSNAMRWIGSARLD